MEQRLLLSAVQVADDVPANWKAHPALYHFNPFPGQGSPFPTGLTPQQLMTAYGVNTITFAGGITGTGRPRQRILRHLMPNMGCPIHPVLPRSIRMV
jgi:hypothetical protein